MKLVTGRQSRERSENLASEGRRVGDSLRMVDEGLGPLALDEDRETFKCTHDPVLHIHDDVYIRVGDQRSDRRPLRRVDEILAAHVRDYDRRLD
jgi:hypothetical protein